MRARRARPRPNAARAACSAPRRARGPALRPAGRARSGAYPLAAAPARRRRPTARRRAGPSPPSRAPARPPLPHCSLAALEPPCKDAAAAGGAAAADLGPAAPRPLWRRAAGAVLAFARAQWFILGVAAAIGLAAALPQLGRKGGWVAAEWSVKVPAIILIFVISGMGLKTRVRPGGWALGVGGGGGAVGG
jgi:hypothetical protein